MEQFVNKVDILTRLRHNNLVTLYGCTSTRSRELLLVYEYIPNGTLADHLHRNRAKDGSLTWPIRMNIAIETAGALAYLHASDVIHCDVKTNNILLDHNFSVKVADFGISRLFPNDVSHISTTPRGTSGYIDPKYHECYQLTSKSDVYSFGVVLVELISSMPAMDMNRHSQEINLANYAMNKIVKSAVNKLIDPSLGFDSDIKTREMTTSVAELAFLCLQTDWNMRPTTVEVLDTLKEIQTNLNANESKINVYTVVKISVIRFFVTFMYILGDCKMYYCEKFLELCTMSLKSSLPEMLVSVSTQSQQVKVFLLVLMARKVQAKGTNDSTCPKFFSCGNLTNLNFPFTLLTQPDCGICPFLVVMLNNTQESSCFLEEIGMML
uniref:Protein kinase domain-containing protein n=1 Tax=Solanum lycopersicum TaxID=4081 RepID=A0A3Q7GE57_SOLLC